MSVNPGFGGQKFIDRTFDKIKELRSMIDESGSSCLIEIDGGVGTHNVKALVDAGADVLLGHGPHVTRAVELYKNTKLYKFINKYEIA